MTIAVLTCSSASVRFACAVCASLNEVISRRRMSGLVCFVSYRKVFTIWYIRRGRSRCDLIQTLNTGYIAVSEVGRKARGISRSVQPPFVTQKTSSSNPFMCCSSFINSSFGINIGNSTSSCSLSIRDLKIA